MSKTLGLQDLNNLIDNFSSDTLKSPFLRLTLNIIDESESIGTSLNSTVSIRYTGKEFLDNFLPFIDKNNFDFLSALLDKHNKPMSKKLKTLIDRFFSDKIDTKDHFKFDESAKSVQEILHSKDLEDFIKDNKFSKVSFLYSEVILALCMVNADGNNDAINNMLNSLIYDGERGLEALAILEVIESEKVKTKIDILAPKNHPSFIEELTEYRETISSEDSVMHLFDIL